MNSPPSISHPYVRPFVTYKKYRVILESEQENDGDSLDSSATAYSGGSSLDNWIGNIARHYRTAHVATAIRFIEPSVYRDASLGPPSEDVSLPSSIAAHVGHPDQIYEIGAKFFQATSLWMPIVSRKRFYADVLNPISPHRRGLILLALTMKLYCAPASENGNDERRPLYQLVKTFYADVEATGPMSVHILQAAVFIAIYEIDQAIYPSAYLSVGTCASKPGLSGVELEEHRRVWWAVLMLDRLLNIGDPDRPLATEEPTFDSFLPVNDKDFNDGTFRPEDAIILSTGFNRKTSLFGGLAQATYLLGQTIKSISSSLSQYGASHAVHLEEDTAQLRRTLHAYVQAVEKWAAVRKLQYCPASAICYIALFMLQEYHWKQVGAATAQEIRSNVFYETKSAWDTICTMAKDPDVGCADPPISRVAGELSTLFRQMIYQTTAQFIMFGFGDPDADTKNKIETLTGILHVMQPRWHLSNLDYTAICLLLDDCWDAEGYTFGRVEGDFNFYVTGRIGSFNVASAAAAATSLRSSYHDLKLIFITGICDGVPGTKGEDGELALGDVVVSKSIVQYDLGRLYSNKLAIKTDVEDSLGRPSRDVRNFIAAMSTRPHRKALEKRAAAHLAKIQKAVANGVIYEYPGSANDVLFEPTYHHKCHHSTECACTDDPSQELSCEETGCDYNCQLPRQRFADTKRLQVNPGWFVFFGRIGSGDTISMSGIYRDQIARELDIIALETGSAGAWDELPCVIVKGVSGYGDGHRNKSWNNWQTFAATTAASTTRALIERYPSTDKTHIMRNRQVYDACLKDLFITDPEADKIRIESTKGGLFEKAYNWVLTNENYLQWRDNAESRLLWIKGGPGKGKTMLLCGIIDELKKDRPTRNVCHFLCQATDSRLDNATSILRGLLHTIIGRQPVLFSHMRDGYEKAGKKLFEDTNSWYSLSQIFFNLVNDLNLQSSIIIIDALDECRTDLSQLLDLIAKDISSSSSKVKWLLSSRNEQDIIDALEATKNKRAISLEVNADSVSKAIAEYINHQVQVLSTLKEYTQDQEAKVERYLHENANGTFLWVALVCAQLKGASRSDPLPKPSEFPAELNSLYGRMITKVCDFKTSSQGRKILAIATVSRRPLTVKEFNSLVDTFEDHRQSLELVWSDILGYCGSFLTLRDGIVYFVHQSAKDFLVTEASAQLFPDGLRLVHTNIFQHCIYAMHKTLKRNMYGLTNPGCLVNQVTLDQVKSSPLTSIAYCCVYWIHHFEQSVAGPALDTSDNTEIHKTLYTFLGEKYVYWLEALSLLKSVFTGMEDLQRLKSIIADERVSGLKDLVQDNYRFIQMFGNVIADFPLQVYIFDGHTSNIDTLDVSWCGTWIASSSEDEIIKIWEAKTGRLIRSMKSHSYSCISFSPWNSNEIACGGVNRDEIIIWDIVTGKMLQQIKLAETEFIKILSLLPSVQNELGCVSHTKDGKSMDISFYNTKSGDMINLVNFPLTKQEIYYLVAFSPRDSRIFAATPTWSGFFGEHGPEVKNLSTGHVEQPSAAYRDSVLSPDGTQLATFTWKPVPMILVCDTLFQKKTCIHRVRSLGNKCALAFSPDSRKLACLLDSKLGVWDISSGSKTKTLLYHKYYCASFGYTVVFSKDGKYLAVAYTSLTSEWDKVKIEIWNVDTSQRFIYLEVLKGEHERLWENFLAFSPSGKFLAFSWRVTERDVTRVEVWDVASRKGVLSKSIRGDDLKSLTGPVSSSQSTTEPSRLKRLSFPDESHLILDMYHHGDIRVIFETKNSSEPAEKLDRELVHLRDGNDFAIDQSNSWINFRGKKLLWLPPEYRPGRDSWDIQQNCILITPSYEGGIFTVKFCCSGCIGRAFTPGWQPGESTLRQDDGV
ncbi:hypothetical protein J3F84DRAFT_392762 [Trichoderma pleuroticola]